MSSTEAEQIGGCGQSRPHLPHDYVIQMDGALLPASCHGIEAPLPEGMAWGTLGQALLILEAGYAQLLGLEGDAAKGERLWTEVGERLRSAIAVDSILEQAGVIERGRTGAYKLAELYRRSKASTDSLVKRLAEVGGVATQAADELERLARQARAESEAQADREAALQRMLTKERHKVAELEKELATTKHNLAAADADLRAAGQERRELLEDLREAEDRRPD